MKKEKIAGLIGLGMGLATYGAIEYLDLRFEGHEIFNLTFSALNGLWFWKISYSIMKSHQAIKEVMVFREDIESKEKENLRLEKLVLNELKNLGKISENLSKQYASSTNEYETSVKNFENYLSNKSQTVSK